MTLNTLFFAILSVSAVSEPSVDIALAPGDSMEEVMRKAVSVTPSPRQLEWQDAEFACFVHFGVNTFTDREWGEGTEDPTIFNPTALDAKQWVAACKQAGIRKLILTAKHHDGFCLWPSQFTEHSVRNSPWREGKGDVVREAADACREGGIAFGFYLSPWDRHEPSYGDSPRYNAHFLNQLRELLTGYGPIAEVWFDGACGEGPNGKRQEYDFPAYYALIRELQPNAVISISGPDVRWVGNEAGDARASEWSVTPSGAQETDPDLGSRDILMAAAQRSAQLTWRPAQVDVSIRPGWFYHTAQDGEVRSLDNLMDIYIGSVGGNAELLLNIPPDQRGLFHENDVKRLAELGGAIRKEFGGANLLAGREPAALTDENPATWWSPADGAITPSLEMDLPGPTSINRLMLMEYLPMGQRVEGYALDCWDGAVWKEIVAGGAIGHKRLLRFPDTITSRIRLRVTAARACPALSELRVMYSPGG